MKTQRIELRVTDQEKLGFEAAAEIGGLALSAWMRERLRRAAIRDLEEASRPIPFLTRESH